MKSPSTNLRRQYIFFIVAQAALAGALLWAGSMTWRSTVVDPLTENLGILSSETGSQIIPWISVSAVISLIAVLGVVATSSWGRRVIGVCAAFAAASLGVSVLLTDYQGIIGWVALVSVLSLGLIATNALAVVRGPSWPRLGRKYERSSADSLPRDPWSALDQGIDPTLLDPNVKDPSVKDPNAQ